MVPKRLRLQAFGPYVKEQVIDFDLFQKDGLFLIEGETGSGKTVLFDAMVYALFGKSSGGQRGDMESMRCRFAQNEVPTFVEFIFEIKKKMYRFYRKVEVRKNRAGQLVYKSSVEAGSYENEQFIPFFENCKLKNVEEKANELLGLTYDQFLQVLLLPQGKFERFLVSKSEEKQEILRSLFPVDKWEQLVEKLSEKANEEKLWMQKHEEQLNSRLSQLDYETIEQLEAGIQIKQQEFEQLVSEYKQQKDTTSALQERYNEQKQLEFLFVEEEQNQKKLLELEKSEPVIKKQEEEKQAMEQLLLLKPYRNLYEDSKNQLNELEIKRNNAEKQQVLNQMQFDGLTEKHKEKEQLLNKIEEVKKELYRLEQMSNVYVDAHNMEEKLRMQIQLCENKQKEIEVCKKDVLEKNHTLDLLKEAQSQREKVLELLPETKQKLVSYEMAYARNQKADAIEKTIQKEINLLDKNKKKKTQQEEQLQKLKKDEEVLYEAFLQDSSAKLASQLQDNVPCPVCGSKEHPHPAVLKEVFVDMVKLKQLHQTRVDLQQELEQTEKICLRKEEEIHTLKLQKKQQLEEVIQLIQETYDKKKHEQLEIERKELEQTKQQYQQVQLQIEKLQQELKQREEVFTHNKDSLQQEIQKKIRIETEVNTNREQRDKQYATYEEWRVAVKEKQKQVPCLEKEVQTIENTIQTIVLQYEKGKSELKILEQQWLQQKQDCNTKYEKYNSKKQELKIAEEKEVKEEDLQYLKEQIDTYYQNKVQVQTYLKQLQLKLKDKTRISLSTLLEQVKEMVQRTETMTKEYSRKTIELEHHQKELQQLLNLSKQIEEHREPYLKTMAFAKAMRGDNRIGIERYVLGVMLSAITQVANDLLKYIHDGRYRLFRSDDVSGKTRKFGLELSVYDSYSCNERNVASLSGGEKFLVSLSLSLALANVVQAQSGGIQMEAMFIDEGFGTLDERSIEDAMQVLAGIRSNKKMIGIISHVEILKQNIPYGIYVKKDKNGSMAILRKGD